MKSLKFYLFACVIIISSCQSKLFYVNDPVIHPDVNEKGDANISGGIHFGEYVSGIHFNGNLAITKNIYLGSSFTKFSGEDGYTSTSTRNGVTTIKGGNTYSGIVANFCTGFYKQINSTINFNMGLGFAYGKIQNLSPTNYTNIIHNKYYFQPGIGFDWDFIDVGISFRAGILNILDYENNDPTFTGSSSKFQNLFLAEPGITISAGRKIKGGIQASYSLNDQNSFGKRYLGGAITDCTSISLFLKLDIDKKSK